MVQASAIKADAEMDVFPQTLKALGAFQMGPQAAITLLDNSLLSGQIVTLDIQLLGGGGPPTTHEADGANPDDWAVGDTLEESATNLAVVLNAEMAGLVAAGTAVADGATVVITAAAADWGNAADIASDLAAGFLLNDAWGSELENFHQFWDSEFNGADGNVHMDAGDYLHIFLRAAIVNGSAIAAAHIRLKYGMGEAAGGHGQMYDEVGMDVGAAALGVLPITTPIVEYQIAIPSTALAVQWYYKRLTIPVNDPMVKVLMTTAGLPDADDTVEILYMRTLRDSVTGGG